MSKHYQNKDTKTFKAINGYYIDKEGKVRDDATGSVNDVVSRQMSWTKTLEALLRKLNSEGIAFNSQYKVITAKPKEVDFSGAPTYYHEASMPTDDLEDNENDKWMGFNAEKLYESKIKELYRLNPWLVKYYISPVPINTAIFKDDTYYLGVKAEIYNTKRERKLAPDTAYSKSIYNNVDWKATFDLIIKDYQQGVFDNYNLIETESKIIYPRTNNISSSDIEKFSKTEMAGLGFSSGRRAILNNERYKLSGELMLGNKHRKIRKELELLNQYQKK